MNFSSYPFLLLAFFLLANLVLGLIKGRGVKTVSDFALGNKNFGGLALAATMLATAIGGNEIYGTSKRLVSIGIVAITGFFLYACSCFIRRVLITNQISRFSDCISFGDFIGKLYGNVAKSFSGFLTGIFCLLQVALQIHLLGCIFVDLFGTNFLHSVIFCTIVISLYTAFGGMHAVVATDILQFVLMFFTLFIIICFIARQLVISNFLYKLPSRLFSTKALTGEYFASRVSILLFLTNIIDISGFQRLLMSRNQKTAKRMYLFTALGMITIGLLLVVIIFFAITTLGDNLNVKSPMNYIVKSLVPDTMIPIIGIGFVAIIFSTGDSYLHSAGLCLSKDFLEPILGRNIKLVEVRFISFFAGISSLFMVFCFNSFLELDWLRYLGTAILAVPVLYGFLGFKSSSKMFWSSAISGFLALLVVSYIPSVQSFKVVFGCLVSLIAYFSVHYYENKGFKFIGNPILSREKD